MLLIEKKVMLSVDQYRVYEVGSEQFGLGADHVKLIIGFGIVVEPDKFVGGLGHKGITLLIVDIVD